MEAHILSVYLKLGIDHILDVKGYDHILFILVLTSIYSFKDWKKILWIITAFTLGHSITLVLASFQIVKINPDLIETLIPVTIIITGIFQIYRTYLPSTSDNGMMVSYMLTCFFGLIHGLGFSNYFQVILGAESDILKPLLAFNVGVEIGQVFIVFCSLLLGSLWMMYFQCSQNFWTRIVSILTTIMATYLLFEGQ
ncbi:MAG: HupE/UreJ family protein [Saprospiraceae bacterium]